MLKIVLETVPLNQNFDLMTWTNLLLKTVCCGIMVSFYQLFLEHIHTFSLFRNTNKLCIKTNLYLSLINVNLYFIFSLSEICNLQYSIQHGTNQETCLRPGLRKWTSSMTTFTNLFCFLILIFPFLWFAVQYNMAVVGGCWWGIFSKTVVALCLQS